MNGTEQADAVKAAQRGDRAAFERLYGEYRDKLYFFVLKNVGSRETAEDIVSETFLAALERIGELRSGEAFGAWLYSVAYKKCADHIKDSSRTAHFESDEERDITIADCGLNEPIQLPEDYAVNKQRAEQLKGIIDSLKPDMKSAVILYYYDELPLKDVAKALGTSESAAKKRLFDARKKIRSKVEKLMKGGAFCAAPMSAVLDSVYDAKTASAAKGVAVVSGASAAKIVSVGAALVMAVGLPVGLYKMNRGWGGDRRTDSDRAIVTDSKADDKLPERIEVGDGYEFRRRFTGNYKIEEIRGGRAIVTDMDGYKGGFAVNAKTGMTHLPTFHNGYCSVPHESKCGLVDTKGNVAVDYGYDEIMYLDDSLWFLVSGEEYFLYDTMTGGEPVKFDLPEGTKEFFGKCLCVESEDLTAVYELDKRA